VLSNRNFRNGSHFRRPSKAEREGREQSRVTHETRRMYGVSDDARAWQSSGTRHLLLPSGLLDEDASGSSGSRKRMVRGVFPRVAMRAMIFL